MLCCRQAAAGGWGATHSRAPAPSSSCKHPPPLPCGARSPPATAGHRRIPATAPGPRRGRRSQTQDPRPAAGQGGAAGASQPVAGRCCGLPSADPSRQRRSWAGQRLCCPRRDKALQHPAAPAASRAPAPWSRRRPARRGPRPGPARAPCACPASKSRPCGEWGARASEVSARARGRTPARPKATWDSMPFGAAGHLPTSATTRQPQRRRAGPGRT